MNDEYWTDSFGYKCCTPPPGMVIILPWAIPASSTANKLRPLKRDPDTSSRFSVEIWYNRHINRYQARLRYKGKKVYVGSFRTRREAEKARVSHLRFLKGEDKL